MDWLDFDVLRIITKIKKKTIILWSAQKKSKYKIIIIWFFD